MAVTVEDLLQLAFPPGTRVVAGGSGLRREVVWARSLRPRPPAFESLEGGELALISSAHLSLLEESMTLSYVIARLARVDVAAVAVLGEVDRQAADVADSVGIPLLRLPDGTSLVEVERAAIATVVDRQAELQRRAGEIHRQLAQITFEEKGLQAVAERLAEICGKSVAIQDEHFRLLFGAAGGSVPPPDELELDSGRGRIEGWIQTVALSSTQPPVGSFPLAVPPLCRLVAPIPVRDGVAGYLSVIAPESELTELDRLATGRGAAVCAVEVAKEAAVGEAEARVRGDLLEQLLSERVEGNQSLVGKARRLGYDPSSPSLVLAFRVGAGAGGRETAGHAGADRARRQMESLLRLELARRETKSLVASRGGMVVAVIPVQGVAGDGGARELAEGIRSRVEAALDGPPVAVGVGRPSQTGTTLATAYSEAEGALGIGVRIRGPSSTTYFGDLGILRLLAQVDSPAELKSFHAEMLGRLEEHDRRAGGELLKTLEALFQCNGNLTRTAERLSLHRNSLLYRLQRIQEITGHDLDEPETRLSLQVALKIRHLLEAEGGRPD